MATNPEEFEDKGISAERLIALLQTLPPGTRVAGNLVRNLGLYDPAWVFLGYIDVRTEELTLMGKEE